MSFMIGSEPRSMAATFFRETLLSFGAARWMLTFASGNFFSIAATASPRIENTGIAVSSSEGSKSGAVKRGRRPVTTAATAPAARSRCRRFVTPSNSFSLAAGRKNDFARCMAGVEVAGTFFKSTAASVSTAASSAFMVTVCSPWTIVNWKPFQFGSTCFIRAVWKYELSPAGSRPARRNSAAMNSAGSRGPEMEWPGPEADPRRETRRCSGGIERICDPVRARPPTVPGRDRNRREGGRAGLIPI